MQEFENYIFDLYGTLLDIKCDERSPELWRFLAQYYAVYGCDWDAESLSETFWRMDAEERDILKKQLKIQCPEIQLEKVFVRLLLEAPSFHHCAAHIAGMPVDSLRQSYGGSGKNEKAALLSTIMQGEWSHATANLFRLTSRSYIRPYPHTIATLRALKEKGKKVFLLSNAQAIFTMPELESSGILPYFDRLYISSDYGMMKPEKAFLERLLSQEALSPAATVMVGNEIQCDVAIALRCGIHSIFLNTGAAPQAEIQQQAEAALKKENAPAALFPEIVADGDIKALLH